jgi:hypothetical protein
MENSTKIYIGVGAAALIAFFLFRKKAVAQTGGTAGGTTGGTTAGGTTAGGTTGGGIGTGGTVPPVRGVDFPACPEGTIAGPRGACVPIDGEPEFIFEPVETPIPQIPSPNPRDSYDYSYNRLNDRFQNERDSYFDDIFQKRGGEAQF